MMKDHFFARPSPILYEHSVVIDSCAKLILEWTVVLAFSWLINHHSYGEDAELLKIIQSSILQSLLIVAICRYLVHILEQAFSERILLRTWMFFVFIETLMVSDFVDHIMLWESVIGYWNAYFSSIFLISLGAIPVVKSCQAYLNSWDDLEKNNFPPVGRLVLLNKLVGGNFNFLVGYAVFVFVVVVILLASILLLADLLPIGVLLAIDILFSAVGCWVLYVVWYRIVRGRDNLKNLNGKPDND